MGGGGDSRRRAEAALHSSEVLAEIRLAAVEGERCHAKCDSQAVTDFSRTGGQNPANANAIVRAKSKPRGERGGGGELA